MKDEKTFSEKIDEINLDHFIPTEKSLLRLIDKEITLHNENIASIISKQNNLNNELTQLFSNLNNITQHTESLQAENLNLKNQIDNNIYNIQQNIENIEALDTLLQTESIAHLNAVNDAKNSCAPVNHASAGTEYGIATMTNYGHIRHLDIQNLVLGLVYPIGSIYESTENVSPASFLGGSWESYGGGQFLLGQNAVYSVESIGGKSTQKFSAGTLYAKMASNWSSGDLGQLLWSSTPVEGWNTNGRLKGMGGPDSTATTVYNGASIGGETSEASILPPYIVVYRWRRVS